MAAESANKARKQNQISIVVYYAIALPAIIMKSDRNGNQSIETQLSLRPAAYMQNHCLSAKNPNQNTRIMTPNQVCCDKMSNNRHNNLVVPRVLSHLACAHCFQFFQQHRKTKAHSVGLGMLTIGPNLNRFRSGFTVLFVPSFVSINELKPELSLST